MTRVLRRPGIAVTAVLAAAAAAVTALGGVARAESDPTAFQRSEITFAAPTRGQSVQLSTRALGPGEPWIATCFRWKGGVNRGQIGSQATGLEFWDEYLSAWTSGLGQVNKPFRVWKLRVALFSSGDCSGSPIATKTPPDRPANLKKYLVDFR